jgi:hypothetical protein
LPYPRLITSNGISPTAEELNVLDAQKRRFHFQMKHIESMILMGNHQLANTKNNDIKRYHVLSADHDSVLCIVTLDFRLGAGAIGFEFNPSKLSPDNFNELSGRLMTMFSYDDEQLFSRGIVSHADFYIDLAGEDVSNFVLIDSGPRSPRHDKRTTYYGERGSRFVTSMCYKAKQQEIGGEILRLEARINRRDILFKDLVEQDQFNPFSTGVIVEPSTLKLVGQAWNNPLLGDRLFVLGLHGAIDNKPARQVIWAFLKERSVSWWQPETFWAAHRELLLKLKPGHAGVFG